VPIRTARLTRAGPQPCAAASLPGLGSNQRRQGSEPCWGHRRPTRNQYGRRDSNSQTAGFEPARYPRFPSRPRAPPEARTPFSGLRVRCITRHACGAERTMVGKQGLEPRPLGPGPSALILTPHPGGPPRIRTGKPSPCKGVALPVGASSPGAAGLARRAARTGLAGACPPASQPVSFFGVPLCICQRAGTFTPQGGAPHGRQELNLQPLVLETSALPVELRPYE
jgi:hypothetical protein